ncbi:DUF5326 family protein [Streptomyces sp. 8N706]|uniref:DUF5326 family protein n=1 Tax=Streptomyces sp. 8N706 TaxID=3457416 RepID=UPI003FD14DC4
MAVKEIFTGLPGWVKWVAVPAVVLLVFGGLSVIVTVVGVFVGVLFKLLLCVAIIAGLAYVVRKFSSSSPSSRGDW